MGTERIGPGKRTARALAIAGLVALAAAASAAAQPGVVGTGEGQIGPTPGNPALDRVFAPGFAPVTVAGSPLFEGDVGLGRILQPGGLLPPPPAVGFFEDRFHNAIFPALELEALPSSFGTVAKVAPAVERWPGEEDILAAAFLDDGSTAVTAELAILVIDLNGGAPVVLTVDAIPTFTPFVDERFAKTDIAVDDQGRITVAYTELPASEPPRIMAQRADGALGALDDVFEVSADGLEPDVALLDPGGNRLVISSVDPTSPDEGTIQLNFVDLALPAVMVSPELDVSTTAAPFGNGRPVVAADPVTGRFTISWDHVTGLPGDPSDIRARRFDAEGLPVGDDFLVNVKPLIGNDNSQGQSDVAYGPGGLSVIAWAADGATGDPDTDIFARAFLPDGTPIVGSLPLAGGQFKVNTGATPGGPLSARQDRPKVRFLPRPDSQGRPQFAVVWRDVGDGGGADPNGTGTSAACFSIDGLDQVLPIFTDGFESGDLASWSSATP